MQLWEDTHRKTLVLDHRTRTLCIDCVIARYLPQFVRSCPLVAFILGVAVKTILAKHSTLYLEESFT